MINEHGIKNSFRLIKADIIDMQGELLNIKTQQARIMAMLDEISEKISQKAKTSAGLKTAKRKR